MFQPLEPRRFLTVTIESNVLTVRGTRADETITLGWNQVDSDSWIVRVNDGKQTQDFNYEATSPDWTSVSVYGGNGRDNINAAFDVVGFSDSNEPPVPIRINGGAGNDVVLGTDNADTILGGSGYDSLRGLDGNDSLDGEGGKDTIVCGDGDDTANGGIGRDKILGEDGNDVLNGGANNDQIDGGEDDDLISGNGGVDALFAGSTNFGPFFRGSNEDLDQDTLYGSAAGDPNDPGDEVFL